MSLWSKIKRFLLLILVIVLFIFVMLLIFPTKKSLDPLYQDVFRNNINSMKYFTNERKKKNVGDKVRISLREMLDKKLLLPFVDKNGNQCDLDKSYVEVTKGKTEYQMKVNLSCSDQKAYIIEILGCTDRCLDCKKEEVKEEKKQETKTTERKIESTSNTSSSSKEVLYQLKRSEKSKELTGYTCPTGYTLSGTNCTKVDSKLITIKATPEYSKKTIETDADAKKTTVKTYNYLYEKEVTTYSYVEDTSKPIFQKTYDNVVGYYKQYVCDGYTYFRDSSTSTTYRTGNWTYSTQKTFDYVPTDTNTTKYVYVGMDYEMCGDTCTLKPYYIYKVYTRTITAETRTESQLRAVCTVKEKQVPIYGLKMTFVGYQTNKVAKKSIDQKWSTSSNDSTLTKQGYKYTGTSKVVSTDTKTTYSCKTGTLSGSKCISVESYISGYTCPFGYSLKGTDCNKTEYTTSKIPATATYKTVTTIYYKWSKTKNEAGWTFTGQTKTI